MGNEEEKRLLEYKKAYEYLNDTFIQWDLVSVEDKKRVNEDLNTIFILNECERVF